MLVVAGLAPTTLRLENEERARIVAGQRASDDAERDTLQHVRLAAVDLRAVVLPQRVVSDLQMPRAVRDGGAEGQQSADDGAVVVGRDVRLAGDSALRCLWLRLWTRRAALWHRRFAVSY